MVFWSQGVAQLEENNIDAHKFENEYVSVTGLVTIYSRDEIASPQMVIRSVADFRFIDKATHDQALKPVIGSNLPTPQKHISTTTPVPIKPTSNFGAVDQMREHFNATESKQRGNKDESIPFTAGGKKPYLSDNQPFRVEKTIDQKLVDWIKNIFS